MAPPTPAALDTDVTWIHGAPSPRRRHDPPLQVHHLAPGTVLIRQSKDLTYEAPFILLLLGERRALLLDTGAVDGTTLRQTVDRLIRDHLAAQTPATHTPATHTSATHTSATQTSATQTRPDPQTPREAQTPLHAYDPDAYELVVAHTHGHGDHVAGDAAFADRPGTTVVGHDVASVCAFFGISEWPTEVVTLDLGGRPLEVFGIPGHHAASIAIHDRTTGLLHTGDTVYPGRIYVNDPNALLDTLDRLVTFAEERTVSHVLGCHVEMTGRPGRDYPLGSRYQPDEPSPFMTVAQLHGVRDHFRAVAHRPGIHRFDDVVFCVGEGPRVLVPLQLRALVEQVRWRLGMLRRRPAR